MRNFEFYCQMMKLQIITLQFSWAWFGSRLNKKNVRWRFSSFFYGLLCLKQTVRIFFKFQKNLLTWWNIFKSVWWSQSGPTVIGIRLNWVNVSSKSDWGQMPSVPKRGHIPSSPSVSICSVEPEICNSYIWFHQQICFEYFLEVTNCLLQYYWYWKMLWML